MLVTDSVHGGVFESCYQGFKPTGVADRDLQRMTALCGPPNAMKPVTAVGIAYAAQEIPAVPVTERDVRLDLVLTEREVIDLRGI